LLNFETFSKVFEKDPKRIWNIIENMLFGFPIVLISEESKKLTEVIEVFRTIIYPFEYQGLIVPYDPEPNLVMLLSDLPFIIGMNESNYEKVKRRLPNL